MESDIDKQIKGFVIQNRENRELLEHTAEFLIKQNSENIEHLLSIVTSAIKCLKDHNLEIDKFFTSSIQRLETQTSEIKIMLNLR